MLVAIIENNTVVSINNYPELKNIDEIRDNFLPNTLLIKLNERPEVKEGYELKYNGSEFYYEEIVEPEYEPTETELIQAELLLNQIDIITKQNEQDEVLAEILLNQMGV